jgi:hypothetical protein
MIVSTLKILELENESYLKLKNISVFHTKLDFNIINKLKFNKY